MDRTSIYMCQLKLDTFKQKLINLTVSTSNTGKCILITLYIISNQIPWKCNSCLIYPFLKSIFYEDIERKVQPICRNEQLFLWTAKCSASKLVFHDVHRPVLHGQCVRIALEVHYTMITKITLLIMVFFYCGYEIMDAPSGCKK